MTRTIVSIYTDNDHISFNLYAAAGDYPDARNLWPFGCTGNEDAFTQLKQGLPGSAVVTNAGTLLFTTLTQHPAVNAAMLQLLASPQDDVSPIYIYLNADQVEDLPWESLYNPQVHFLALDRRWPIARIADTTTMTPMITHTLHPPLKIMLVLAAAGIDATPEWQAFYEAMQATLLPLSIQVFVCQDELLAAITAQQDPRVQVQYLASASDLLSHITTFSPHMLHFFCHGSIEGGTHLQITTRPDWLAADTRGSVALEPDQLRQAVPLTSDVWLVILNSCLGAATGGNAHSLARSLVMQGFPAVIGMREAIASDAAHTFCKAFYPAAFQQIPLSNQALADPDTLEPILPLFIEWSNALYAPRAQLCDLYSNGQPQSQAAAAYKQWTLPIIYVRPEPFMLNVRETNPALTPATEQALQAEIDTLRKYRTFMQTKNDTPPCILMLIDTRIAALEVELYGEDASA